jgi:hypothetical protein
MVGTTVYLKTSGEAVFVLAKQTLPAYANSFPELGSDLFTVRRPITGQNGISHVTEFYYPQELETTEEILDRRMAEQKSFEARLEAARKEANLDDIEATPTLTN